MEEISVSEEQHEFLEQLRQELSEQVVGPYGTVRQRDAVQFLIDNLDDGALTAAADEAASATTSLSESGGGAGGGTSEAGDETDTDGDADGDAVATEDDDEGDDKATGDTGDGGDDEGAAGGSSPAPGGAGDDDRLSAMMNLLETHDDKWEKGDSPEARYVVTLPDGETEQVKTKDDVKALLFKNY